MNQLNIYFIFFFFLCFTYYSQNKVAIQYYNGAASYYERGDYRAADSLFTISNNIHPDKDTYYGRALCRGKMENKQGYCEDLRNASVFGEQKATMLFLKTCGRIDTSYEKLDQNFTKTIILSRLVTYAVDGEPKFVAKQKYASQQSDSAFEKNSTINPNLNKSNAEVEVMPEFPGGINEAYQFVSKNLSIPKTDNPRIANNKVFVKFKIFEDGTIHDIFIIKNAIDCAACDTEATRVIAIMPRWKPATIKGLPVKCYYTMPIVF